MVHHEIQWVSADLTVQSPILDGLSATMIHPMNIQWGLLADPTVSIQHIGLTVGGRPMDTPMNFQWVSGWSNRTSAKYWMDCQARPMVQHPMNFQWGSSWSNSNHPRHIGWTVETTTDHPIIFSGYPLIYSIIQPVLDGRSVDNGYTQPNEYSGYLGSPTVTPSSWDWLSGDQ